MIVASDKVDVTAVAPRGATAVEFDVFAEPSLVPPRAIALFCVPGGGMSRRYWDIDPPREYGNYSMARHLAARGYVVVTIDPLGVGGSSRPDDGYTLTLDTVAAVNHAVVVDIARRLRAGSMLDALAAMPALTCIGLGHSAGAKITTVQQANHRTYAGLCLLGFGAAGLPQALTAEELQYANDADGFKRNAERLARARNHDDPLPPGTTATSPMLLAGMDVPPPVLEAAARTSSALLALVGLASMMPGSTAAEIATIAVPAFVGVGQRDIGGPPHEIPAAFRRCGDFTLYVLPDAGHNHNVAPNREQLWDRVDAWLQSLRRYGAL